MRWLAIFAALWGCSAFADSLTLGYGGVREYGKLSNYQVLTADWQFTNHLELSVGDVVGGKPDIYQQNARYNVGWCGVSFVEREDYLFDSIGVVRITHKTYHLTSPYQFYLVFGVKNGPWSISYRHLSNGGTGGANYGEDMAVIGFTWR